MARRKRSRAEIILDPQTDSHVRLALQVLERADEHAAPGASAATLDLQIIALGASLRCVSCDAQLVSTPLYCAGNYCDQFAGTVRYARKAIADGRMAAEDVQAGFGVRVLMLTGGGYPTSARAVGAKKRAEILERDRETCQNCFKPGNEIDHIDGDSDNSSNLRVLCRSCNMGAASENARMITRDSDPEAWERIDALIDELGRRIGAASPLRVADDPERWTAAWRRIKSERRALA